jgi:MtN3 and saliva related transmembrane protein
MSIAVETLGMIAGTLTTIAFVPQVLKIYRTKSAKDVSYLMFSIFSTGIVFWLIYGILIRSTPIIAANAVTLTLSVIIIALKVRYHR